jgi:hypothetical protein
MLDQEDIIHAWALAGRYMIRLTRFCLRQQGCAHPAEFQNFFLCFLPALKFDFRG